jgi:hypothetical protein
MDDLLQPVNGVLNRRISGYHPLSDSPAQVQAFRNELTPNKGEQNENGDCKSCDAGGGHGSGWCVS